MFSCSPINTTDGEHGKIFHTHEATFSQAQSGTVPSNFVIAAAAAADVSLTPEGAATFKPAELPLPSASIAQECWTSRPKE